MKDTEAVGSPPPRGRLWLVRERSRAWAKTGCKTRPGGDRTPIRPARRAGRTQD